MDEWHRKGVGYMHSFKKCLALLYLSFCLGKKVFKWQVNPHDQWTDFRSINWSLQLCLLLQLIDSTHHGALIDLKGLIIARILTSSSCKTQFLISNKVIKVLGGECLRQWFTPSPSKESISFYVHHLSCHRIQPLLFGEVVSRTC